MSIPEAAQLGQKVLVLQGGGALGAYHAGVYHALHEAGMEPDWVIGTSIGAVNASIIAGNKRNERLARLREFWHRAQFDLFQNAVSSIPYGGDKVARLMAVVTGLPEFFTPNPLAAVSSVWPVGPDNAAFYSTEPLRKTLTELVNFDQINRGEIRISVSAANVCTSEMHYFDNRDGDFRIEHVLASGAMPPGFPAVRVDGQLYWDGGVLSNTPLEVIFDDNPRRSGLVFSVSVWNSEGPEPRTIAEVLNREKDVHFANRTESNVERQQQIHKLRHIIAELTNRLPETDRESNRVRELASYGCLTRMHVVALAAPIQPDDDYAKDIDFSSGGIHARWDAGYTQAMRAIEAAPWTTDCDSLEGIILHWIKP
jgi:NTE family protein